MGGGEGRVGWGVGREEENCPGEDMGPSVTLMKMVLTTQLDRRDAIPVEGRIPGSIGMLHRCQCVGHGFTRL